MLDFICADFAGLRGMGMERKIQNENIYLQPDSSQQTFAQFERSSSVFNNLATLTEMFKCA